MGKNVEYKYKELSAYFYKRLIEFSEDAKYLNVETLNYIIDEILKDDVKNSKDKSSVNYNIMMFEERLFIKFLFVRDEVIKHINKVVAGFSSVNNSLTISDEIIGSIISTCLTNYSFEDIISGKKDKEIQQMYFSQLSAVEKTIGTLLKEYVDNNIEFKLDYDKFEQKIVNQVLFRGYISLSDIVSMNEKAKHYIRTCSRDYALENVSRPVVDVKKMMGDSVGDEKKEQDEIVYEPKKKNVSTAVKKLMDFVALYGFFPGYNYAYSFTDTEENTDIYDSNDTNGFDTDVKNTTGRKNGRS